MTATEYENEVPCHYFVRVESYNNMVIREKRFARLQTFLCMVSGGNMKSSFNMQSLMRAMPLPGDEDERQDVIIMTPERHREIQEAHNKI